MIDAQIPIPYERIESFCRKWRVTEFALFGSVLTPEFRPDSDVDVLVTFEDGAPWSLLDVGEMHEELQGIFKRKVDLVEKKALRNPYRKRHILSTYRVVYAA